MSRHRSAGRARQVAADPDVRPHRVTAERRSASLYTRRMAAPAFATRTKYLRVAEPFRTESGASLPEITLAYETYGRLDAERRNCVLACHALSGDAHAAGVSDDASASAVDGFGAGGRA